METLCWTMSDRVVAAEPIEMFPISPRTSLFLVRSSSSQRGRFDVLVPTRFPVLKQPVILAEHRFLPEIKVFTHCPHLLLDGEYKGDRSRLYGQI